MHRFARTWVVSLVALAACTSATTTIDAQVQADAGPAMDVGGDLLDAAMLDGAPLDPDAAELDTGTDEDAGAADVGPPDLGPDTGVEPMRRVLETAADGNVISGSVAALATAQSHRGDLKVAYQDWVLRCTDTSTFAGGVSCGAWLPITVEVEGPRWAIPEQPDWLLARLNTSGLVDRAGYRADRHFSTENVTENQPLAWFARDWRQPGFAYTRTGTGTSGTRQALLDALRAGTLGTPFAARPSIIRIDRSEVAALQPWRVSVTEGARGVQLDDDLSHLFQWYSTSGDVNTQRWAFAGTVDQGATATTAPGQWWMEPGWIEALAHSETGTVTSGSVAGLLAEIDQGAEVAVVVGDDLIMRCTRVIAPLARDRALCTVRGGYDSVATSTGVRFVSPVARELRSVATDGTSVVEPLRLGQETPPPTFTTRRPVRWFTNRAGMVELFSTGRRGVPDGGDVQDVVAAARAGADIRVVSESEQEVVVKECHSLKVNTAQPRVGCVELSTRPGLRYLYFAVHTTDGHVRDYRVCDGSSNGCGTFHEITERTRWFARR